MKNMRSLAFIIGFSLMIVATGAPSAWADVSLPAIFSDHMVLQGEAAVPVWGWAEPNEQVTVSIAGQTKSATADASGKWMVKLDKLKSGEAATLSVTGKNTLVVNDVLVGDVWLCAGQSNMLWPVAKCQDFDQEKAAANFPKIRMFCESSGSNPIVQEKCAGKWELCSPETIGKFSATAYFFGREVHQKTRQPVGLITSSVGGTPIEAWTSVEAQQTVSELKPLFERWKKLATWDLEKAKADYEKQLAKYKEDVAAAEKDGAPTKKLYTPQQPVAPRIDNRPGNLFNAKIAPLIPYAIRGAIWYQGEANAIPGGGLYNITLPLLIKDWRTRWGQGDFPFAWVQLPNYGKPQEKPVEDGGWPCIREFMLKTLSVPNTGMAITIDVGEVGAHPKNKQAVGQRLALWALAKVYGQNGPSSGPLPAEHEIKGNEIICSFRETDGGLVAKGGELKGFAIAGADKKWVKASARIDGDKVIVSSPEVKEPKAVRYAWAFNPDCNLYNGAGLPASPFRTDDGK